jgi:integrase
MLTSKSIRELTPPAKGSRVIYDRADGDDPQKTVSGFGAQITAAGTISFVLNYRVAGIERRMTIGRFPTWSASAAREKARELRRMIDDGRDPLGERIANREAPTVRDLTRRYLEEHAAKKRSRYDDEGMLRKWIEPALGGRKVVDITHDDIDRLHAKITKAGSPIRANRCTALASKMFSLAIRWGWRSDNPAKGVERNPEDRRSRYLNSDELARLSAALATHPSQQAANAVRLLLLTGARRMEVLAARWDQLDSGIWTKPASYTKQKREHRLPLSAPALQLLSEIPRNGPFVFPGRNGRGHLQDLKKSWAALCKAADLEGLRLHDLRHTYASLLASSGASLPLIGSLLGHTQPGTTARYAHLHDEAQRAAAERVGAIVTGGGGADVITFPKARES